MTPSDEALIEKLRDQRVSLAQVRDALPSEKTLVVTLALGTERSFLWALTRDRFESFELPPRQQLSTVIKKAYEEIQEKQYRKPGTASTPALDELSKTLLADLVEREGDWLANVERWLIIPDGVSHYVPWAALPWTTENSPGSLIHNFQLTTFPSAPSWYQLQSQSKRRSKTPSLAVVGDPVLDSRLFESNEGAHDPIASKFPRLRYARLEGENIAELVEESKTFFRFEANRQRILEGLLANFGVIQFSTHAVLHRDPQRHGLWLSRFDEGGREVNGFLTDRDIRQLDLRADLVVLSGCETALGEETAVEGFLGMTQAFFQAGTARLVVSLWAVDDAATSVLMEDLHKAYWDHDLSASAALRDAQLGLLESDRFNAPFYWAGFVQQGRLD
ncbi:MAG: CHAT domain-containing protein [Acidobacteriota bacterium]